MRLGLGRLLREPLLHFCIVSGLIFFLFSALDDDAAPASDAIVISAERVDQLAAQFASVWKRAPTEDELKFLVDGYIREEVYYRGALELGLDKNDTVVRQRLRQKMEFLTDTSAQLLEPAPEELEAYWRKQSAVYAQGARRAIEQVYLGQTPTTEQITAAMDALRSDSPASASGFGERSLLPAQLGLSLPEAIDSVYGQGFSDQIKDLPVGVWSGPTVSAYGTHLVRVLQIDPGVLPSLETVRESVVTDWQADKALQLRELDYAERRSRFVVEIAPDAGISVSAQ